MTMTLLLLALLATACNADSSNLRGLATASTSTPPGDVLADFKNRNLLQSVASPVQWTLNTEASLGEGVAPVSLIDLESLPSVFSQDAEYYQDYQKVSLPSNALYKSTRDPDTWVLKSNNVSKSMAIRTDPSTHETTVLLPMDPDLNVFTLVTPRDVDPQKMGRFSFEFDNHQGDPAQPSLRQFDQSGKRTPCIDYKVIELAIAYESRFCQIMGGKERANEVVQITVARASLKFEVPGICAKLKVQHLEGFCEPRFDPYYNMFSGTVCNSDDKTSLLQLFRNYWKQYRTNVKRDVAHLFHGFNHASGTIGCAWQGTLCNFDHGYGVNELTFGGNDNPHFWSILFAHELGHSVGAPHEPYSSKTLMDVTMCNDCDEFSDTSIAYMKLNLANKNQCLASESDLDGMISNDDLDNNNNNVIVDTKPQGDTNTPFNNPIWNDNTCGKQLDYCNLQPCCANYVCYGRFLCL